MATMSLTAGNLGQYEGYRINQEGQPAIYLVLDGKRHHIPNPTTYNNLCGNSDTRHAVLDVNIVPDGGALSDGAILARPNNAPNVYLVSNGKKRHVTSPAAMAKFGFDGVIRVVDHVLLDFIPTGGPIS